MSDVSIIMSVYNESERYIRESLNSLMAQLFSNFECIIIVDNPERNDVELIVDSYHDSRFKIYKNKKNIGLALSMNRAAELSSSVFLARMDADDIADPQKLSLGIRAIKDKDVDVVFSNYTFIDAESAEINRYKRDYSGGIVDSRKISINPNMIHHPTVMMRKKIFDEVGGYRDFPCAQDSDLWLRMQEYGAKFYYIETPLLKYRINPFGVTQSKYIKQSLTTLYIYSLSIERIRFGKDSYSNSNYNSFLRHHGIDSAFQQKLLIYGDKLLTRSKSLMFPLNHLFRLLAFILAPQKRCYYLMVKKKKSLLSRKILFL